MPAPTGMDTLLDQAIELEGRVVRLRDRLRFVPDQEVSREVALIGRDVRAIRVGLCDGAEAVGLARSCLSTYAVTGHIERRARQSGADRRARALPRTMPMRAVPAPGEDEAA